MVTKALPKDCVRGRFRFQRMAVLFFNGLPFEVGIADHLSRKVGGLATQRSGKHRIIAFSKYLPERYAMEVALHEALHACFDERLSEKEVTRVARDLARLLRTMGFHRHAEPEPRKKARRS